MTQQKTTLGRENGCHYSFKLMLLRRRMTASNPVSPFVKETRMTAFAAVHIW
jgi:hypothetical protein